MLLVLVSGCGRISFDPLGDGGLADDGGNDGAATCQWGQASVLPIVNSASFDWGMWMSSNRRELVFASSRGGNFDLYIATRSSTVNNFGSPTLFLSDPAYDDNPHVSADNIEFWYSSDRTGDQELWSGLRASAQAATPPFNRPGIDDEAPALSSDRRTLFFDSTELGSRDIMRADRATVGSPWGTPALVPEVSSSGNFDCCPSEADDGTFVFVSAGFGNALQEVMISTHQGTTFSPPVVFAPASSNFAVHDAFITPDGKTILWSRDNGAANADIFYADCQ